MYTSGVIEIKNLTKQYGDRAVVDKLSLSIPSGQVFGFLGPNGAGKTTTIKMIVGLIAPTSGTITTDGHPSSDPAMRESIGFMPEAPSFYDRLTGMEFMQFANALFPKKRRRQNARLEAILEETGIADAKDLPIRTYSKGMRQRLAFAQALVNDPEYLFLDEPLDGMDPIGRKEMKGVIKQLAQRGKTIFFNSHILFDTEELCDAIGILHRGALLYTGPLAKFVGSHKSLEDAFVETIQKHTALHAAP